ncbi:MAG: glutaredoxin family protein [Burkholderiales bacterium]|jgi:glutaredoxin|nr:glutaredoxin family protein [Burkholderiales bacterium]
MRIFLLAIALFLLPVLSFAQAQTMFRYIDETGRVVYTDKPPAPDQHVSDLQRKNPGGNYIEVDKIPFETRYVMERFPLTLYASNCGSYCEQAEAFLKKRGVPYAFVDTGTQEGNKQLRERAGNTKIPSLQIGTDILSGFNEASWGERLNQAGYAQDAGARDSKNHVQPAVPTPTDKNIESTEPALTPPAEPPSDDNTTNK